MILHSVTFAVDEEDYEPTFLPGVNTEPVNQMILEDAFFVDIQWSTNWERHLKKKATI